MAIAPSSKFILPLTKKEFRGVNLNESERKRLKELWLVNLEVYYKSKQLVDGTLYNNTTVVLIFICRR